MSNLTIAQGLRQKSKLKGQLAELQLRAYSCVAYKATDKPAFSFNETVAKLDLIRDDLTHLETEIAIANAQATVPVSGMTIPLALAVRKLQELKGLIAWYRGLPCRAQVDTKEEEWGFEGSNRVHTYTDWKCDLAEADRAAKVETLQAEFDSLNDSVERVNHATLLSSL